MPSKKASETYERIYAAVKRIPKGRVATYGQVAALAGRPGQPRLVGYALRSLPEGMAVPWHRVINARGEISLRGGPLQIGEESIQQVLLRRERIRFDSANRVDLARYQWKPSGRPGGMTVSRRR